ncbi:MAG: DNA cytosine methyltransferase [Lentisphaeraceae bacterium]|nr:DNA cytosine methyltransferase [Lentisphaeraceae bacterium]
MVKLRGTSNVADIEKPSPTITAGGNHLALAEPFLVHYYGGDGAEERSSSLDRPLPTQTAGGSRFAIAEPFVVNISHSKAKPNGMIRSCEDPIPTLVTTEEQAVCEPFLVQFYGSSGEASIDNPLPTITCVDRFGIVQAFGVDVHFRMLKPHELSAAMSFPKDYKFTGNQRDQVKQIGNAVPVCTAKALASVLVAAIHKHSAKGSTRKRVEAMA